MPTFLDRLQHAWNAFLNRAPTGYVSGNSSGFRPDRTRLFITNERSIINAIYTRISVDAAQIKMVHARLDDDGAYRKTIPSLLNSCLNVEANKDQTGRAFRQDIVMSMLDEGYIAVVPVDITDDISNLNPYDIETMRVGKILEWYPDHVRVDLYNDRRGLHEQLVLPKKMVAIVENPFYSVMNEPNSTLKRLVEKLNILDDIDKQSGSGKLDLIIQLPYTIKSEARREQAERRRKDIEDQLSGSKYGIAYTDGTEHITQLNRAVENNLMTQIEYLTRMLFSQLGITESILDGTADEQVMLNYYNRTLEPIMSAIADEFIRKFLSKTARTQKQSIYFFRDPFRLIPAKDLAEMVDKFTRNEVMTSNEFRPIVGLRPSDDPDANVLRNKNLNKSKEEVDEPVYTTSNEKEHVNEEV